MNEQGKETVPFLQDKPIKKIAYTLKDLEMPDDEPMVIIRSSHLWICEGDKYAAAALNMYIHWTRWLMKHKPIAQTINTFQKNQKKKATQDTSLIIYRKQEELVEDLLGFCSEKRLRQVNTYLVSRGLLKIQDMPQHLSDHVLRYEVQIGRFKELLNDWRNYREESQKPEDENDENEGEVALEADEDGADFFPLRSGKMVKTVSLERGHFTARSGLFSPPVVIDNSKENDNKQIGCSPSLRDDNNFSFSSSSSQREPKEEVSLSSEITMKKKENVLSPRAKEPRQTLPPRLNEQEEQIIAWFCEFSGTRSVNMKTKAAQECMVALLPKIQTREDARTLYEETKKDIEARTDITNHTVFFANQKDSLFNWERNKGTQVVEVVLPELTEEESEQQVLWTRRPSKLNQMIANGYDSIEDHEQYLEWMPFSEARDYYYGYPGEREYTAEEIEHYRHLRQSLTLVAV